MDLRARAEGRLRQAEAYLAAGDDRSALRAFVLADGAVDKLLRREPDEIRHTAVAGSISYNLALLWDRAGRGKKALDAAWRSVLAYRHLVTFAHLGGPLTPDDAAAHHAEAQARLARLIGRYDVPGSRRRTWPYPPDSIAHEVMILDNEAITVYQELVGRGSRTRADLDRIQRQFDAAVASLRDRGLWPERPT